MTAKKPASGFLPMIGASILAGVVALLVGSLRLTERLAALIPMPIICSWKSMVSFCQSRPILTPNLKLLCVLEEIELRTADVSYASFATTNG